MTRNEPYIGKNLGQVKDNNSNESNDSNIITNNIKLTNDENVTL